MRLKRRTTNDDKRSQRGWARYCLPIALLVLTGYVALWSATIYFGVPDCDEEIARYLRQADGKRIEFNKAEHDVLQLAEAPYPQRDCYAVEAFSPCPCVVRVKWFSGCPWFVAGGKEFFVWVFGATLRIPPLRQEYMREAFPRIETNPE